MIKITIIVILILLLLVTLYSYYCLSSSMIEFEQKRMEYILNKENELKNLENKIKTDTECVNKNDQYQTAIKGINAIIDKLNLPPGSICAKYSNEEDKKTISTIKSIILEKIPNLNQNQNQTFPQPSPNILHEVPSSYASEHEQKQEQEQNENK